MIVALGFATLVPPTAQAQSSFFANYTFLGVASCSTTNIQGTLTASYNLPASSNNLVSSISINGGPAEIDFFTINPPQATNSPLFFSFPIPATPQPYTIHGTAFPAQGGAAIGSGVSAQYTCNTDGTVTAVFDPLAGVSTAVPTLSQWSLAGLSILLAMASLMSLRRKQ